MTAFIQANTIVVEHLLQQFTLTDAKDVVAARLALGAQVREAMQHPETYTIPIDQQLPAGITVADAAKYVHPWNVACALVNLCTNMPRFGGDPIAPQEDLQLYATEWAMLGSYTFPAALVPKVEPPAVQPSNVAQLPLPHVGQAPVSTAGSEQSNPSLADAGFTELPASLASAGFTPADMTDAAAQGFRDGAASGGQGIQPVDTDLPDPSITLERTGQSGRPQKSPFEKKIESRKSVGKPPFWWAHLLISARKLFAKSPAGALDNSSEGAGPVQSYMVLLALMQQVLAPVDAKMTVGALRDYLREIDEQVSALSTAAAANQLRDELIRD